MTNQNRAAEMLTAYAEMVKATGAYAEEHYIPEVEFVIAELRAGRAAPPPLPAGWRLDRSSCLDGDECFVISGDPMACGEYIYRASQPVVFAFLSALAARPSRRTNYLDGEPEISEGLKPCPWCGSEADVFDVDIPRARVECPSCGAAGPTDLSDPVAAWNRRAIVRAAAALDAGRMDGEKAPCF